MHPKALTPAQRRLLAASGDLARKWGAYLGGGSAVALHLGHRFSEDFDWFTRDTVSPAALAKDLESLGVPVKVTQNTEGTFLAQVDSIQWSVFRYRYPLISVPAEYEGCSVAGLRDLAAMKMTAIVQRTTKRDYVDLHAMLVGARLSLGDVITTMSRKYPGLDPAVAMRALTYFTDVEEQAMPKMIARTTWEDVKAGLVEVSRKYERTQGQTRGR